MLTDTSIADPISIIALSLLVAVSAGAAQADERCALAHAFVQGEHKEMTSAFPGLPEATCQQTRSLAGDDGLACHWAYDYRSDMALSAFHALTQRFDTCFGTENRLQADLAVNHPDSYDLRQYVLDGQIVSLSLKDKAALSRTFVFIRVDLGADG